MGYDVGAAVPLNCQLPDPTMTGNYVQAVLRKADGTSVAGSPVSLTHVANGYYSASFPMPNLSSFVANYLCYDDSGHTVLTSGVTPGVDIFDRNGPIAYVSEVTGKVSDGDACEMAAIVIGEDKTIFIRLLLCDGAPYDLTGVTAITVNMRKADGTVLSKTLLSGAVVLVGNALLGKIAVTYLAADTDLLNPGLLATVEVRLTQASLLTIIEIRNAINVVDSLS